MRSFLSALTSSSDDFAPWRRRLWATATVLLGIIFLAQLGTIVLIIWSVGS